MNIWILVANASEAYLYSSESLHTGDLQLIRELRHPESREKGLDLISDRPGHYQTDHKTRSAYEKTHPKEDEAENFARELGSLLKKGNYNHDYQQLILVTAPHFYGLINKHMNFTVDKLIHIAKDYTKLTERDLITQLQKQLF